MSPADSRELAQELVLALEGMSGMIRVDPKCPLTLDSNGGLGSLCEAKICPACVIRHLARTLQRSNSDQAADLGRELMLASRGRCEGGVHA